MPYQQGYPQGQYAGYQGYGQVPHTRMYQTNQQTQYGQPMVVIPQQPRHGVRNFEQTSPLPYQPQSQPGFHPQSPAQYQNPYTSQHNHYYPHLGPALHSQGVPNQSVQYQHHAPYQPPYQVLHSQAFYQQPAREPPIHASPQTPFQQLPRQPSQSSPSQPYHAPSPSLPSVRRPSHSSPSAAYPTSSPALQPVRKSRAPAQAAPVQSRSHFRAQRPAPQHQSPQDSRAPNASTSSQQQRVFAHVEIPVPKPMPSQPEMAPSPKRRRSNEGHAVPVCDEPVPQKRSMSQQKKQAKQAPVSSSPLTELTSSQMPSTPNPSVDYQSVLLALADEYINTAHGMSTALAVANDSEREEKYYGLISTAMGCLESVLNNYRLSNPRREARIRLRLATLLLEETENDMEAEEVLSKGITLCERSRLPDLKYAMHHLLSRVMFKSNPKAALKAVDRIVQEVQALNLVQWVYCFRFLRVSLGLEVGGQSSATFNHLAEIATAAEEQRHISVQIVAAVLEVIVHLRSGSDDAVDLAQRSMAAARTHQLGSEMQQMPQIRALLDCLDLMCNLVQFNPDQAVAKMDQMHKNLDTATRDAGWSKDGAIHVELMPSANTELEQDTCGIMKRTSAGQAAVAFRWITNSEMYALGFLLSGLAAMHKNSIDGKAEQYLGEGLKLSNSSAIALPQSLVASTAIIERLWSMSVGLRLHMIYAWCGRSDWLTTWKAIKDIREEFAQRGSEIDESTARILLYLEGMCRQGLGELQAALELYESPALVFEVDSKVTGAEKDIRVLATLNSILIWRTRSTEESTKADSLLLAVESHCLKHSNRSMAAACHMLKATSQASNGVIVKTKQYLQAVVQASQAAMNQQLLYIAMNSLTNLYFRNIVGDQAEKSARVGRSLARKAQDKLWTAVADDMYGETLERSGKAIEAAAARREAADAMAALPKSLMTALQQQQRDDGH